jgi:Ran GTPase-activating protein (RanGAP) involved in mRNA processing and transport|mmetsp:Transcript_3341/g.6342  ORF Transcript_3341/g.6342 Transcript_3341/m.6342 type:complete len:713 (-) Transcript_3341:666-2804(-)|eukprot:CAMPEP_0174303538 /NCGR_PEP_ID=MMETSP0809-20121228/60240_1 /TAXON_ID=73025 ORGANISM="Eutreptiella gymnastica-like, Strain CCMP1594" /NCGR_SAMPLE_ID=MMETSP0809 /ASSEMBLY_ACC=CAM_ASM_000658 /LENGTH=712 /DNA_ID=CAMNT_0015409577 /DNA_START=81 /DNA_END=2219 /DNA_ORIENTATION=+
MKASTPGLLWNGTAHAESAAFRALEAAKKAQRAAELATNIANQNQEATQAAITAQHQNLSSPVKAGLKGSRQFFDTSRAGPNTFSEGQPVDVKKYQDALAQLTSSAAIVDFPSLAIDNEVLPAVVDAIKANTNLTHLNLKRAIPTNTMAEAVTGALQGNQSLVYLNLSGNKMGDMSPEEPNLVAITKLKGFLDECETVRHVDVSDNNFGAAGTELVCQGVRESISIKILDLSGNNILTAPEGDDEAAENGANALKELLTKNKFLDTLILRNNMLNNDGMETLADAFKATTRLTHLDLSDNQLGSPGATVVGDMLTANNGIRVLDISDNKIGWKGIVSIGDAIANKNRTVTNLILQKNKFGCSKEKKVPQPPTGEEEEEPEPEDPEEAAEKMKEEALKLEKATKVAEKAVLKLAEILKNNDVLKEMDVAYNLIGAQQLCVLINEVKTNSSLTSLNLEMNHLCGSTVGEFQDVALNCLADALEANTTLAKLNLRWNFVQAEGATILSKALTANSALSVLNVSRNFLGDEGLKLLLKGLAKNTSVQSLALSCNALTADGIKSLAKLLKKGSQLKILDLSENEFGATGFQMIAEASVGSALTAMDLSRCAIGDCPRPIAEMLENGPLESLDMSDNPVTSHTVQAATHALKNNTCLSSLMLWGRQDGDNLLQAQLAIDLLKQNPTITALDFGFANVSQDLTDQINGLLRSNATKSLQ